MTTNYKNRNTKKTNATKTERITAKTLAENLAKEWRLDFQAGSMPWRKPWYTLYKMAVSHLTGKGYSLSNQILLGAQPGEYCTFLQVKNAGGKVKKGEHAKHVLFSKMIEIKSKQPETEETQAEAEQESEQMPPMMKRIYVPHLVFSIDQTEGLERKWAEPAPREPLDITKRNPKLDEMIRTFGAAHNLQITEGWEAAFECAGRLVHIPEFERFETPEAFYSTYFHELSHVVDEPNIFSYSWDIEARAEAELVAELSSALILKYIGHETDYTNENTRAYLDSWGKYLEAKPTRIFPVIARAERAAREILGISEDAEPVEAEPEKEKQPKPEPMPEPVQIATPSPVKSNPRPLRAILLDDDDDDDADLVTCQIVGLNL